MPQDLSGVSLMVLEQEEVPGFHRMIPSLLFRRGRGSVRGLVDGGGCWLMRRREAGAGGEGAIESRCGMQGEPIGYANAWGGPRSSGQTKPAVPLEA